MSVVIKMCIHVDEAEFTYEEIQREMKAKLMALADNACSYIHHDRYGKLQDTDPAWLNLWCTQ